jgi:hypothetical protein
LSKNKGGPSPANTKIKGRKPAFEYDSLDEKQNSSDDDRPPAEYSSSPIAEERKPVIAQNNSAKERKLSEKRV